MLIEYSDRYYRYQLSTDHTIVWIHVGNWQVEMASNIGESPSIYIADIPQVIEILQRVYQEHSSER